MKEFEIERSLKQIAFQAGYAINNLEHYKYGEVDAKQRVVNSINNIKRHINDLEKENGVLHKFLFLDE